MTKAELAAYCRHIANGSFWMALDYMRVCADDAWRRRLIKLATKRGLLIRLGFAK